MRASQALLGKPDGAGFNGTVVGWCLMGFGAVGLLGNSLGGRAVDRHPLIASMVFCLFLIGGIGLGLALSLFFQPLLLGRRGVGLAPLRQDTFEILDLQILQGDACRR